MIFKRRRLMSKESTSAILSKMSQANLECLNSLFLKL